MTRTVFYGFGAFVGSITGPTTCSFWPDDPIRLNWDPAKLISVDLAMSPRAVGTGSIAVAAIQVDDFAGWGTGGLTKIGPSFPFGQMAGSCWLESSFWNALGHRQPRRVPAGMRCRDYELTAFIDWSEGRRFYGVHAEILQHQGALAQVSIWNPGTSLIPNQAPAGTWWLDLAQVADPITAGFTGIGIAANNPKSGPLFLDGATALQLQLSLTKHPWYLGEEPLIAGRTREAERAARPPIR